ncbi:MAG TPA: protein-L-isoaspartate(D-aspartate) O-methyltransferase [Aggregatilineales bacterium]|nr:protein-L-isoaspartate(D-aspartate) O-methyltransferase [Aggregatilineales bacterium]
MDYEKLRLEMVEEQLEKRDIFDFRTLNAMRQVPRHEFVPEELRQQAYQDRALSIGHNQTISQPYVVALMLQLLQLSGHETVLEVGTGSGYQTALLCEMTAYVYSIERSQELAESAADRLAVLEYENVDIHVGDGSQGLADMGPYDAIIVSACVPSIPGPLRAQLHPNNGRLILPVGSRDQQYLQLVKRDFDRWDVETLIPVRFVPLVGKYGFDHE